MRRHYRTSVGDGGRVNGSACQAMSSPLPPWVNNLISDVNTWNDKYQRERLGSGCSMLSGCEHIGYCKLIESRCAFMKDSSLTNEISDSADGV